MILTHSRISFSSSGRKQSPSSTASVGFILHDRVGLLVLYKSADARIASRLGSQAASTPNYG